MVYSNSVAIDENGKEKYRKKMKGNLDYNDIIRKCYIQTPSCTLIRRWVFEKIGYFDENSVCFSAEDWDYWVRISRDYSIKAINKILTYYRVHHSGISRSLDRHLHARLYVVTKAIEQHKSDPRISNSEFSSAILFSLHSIYRTFAYSYHYISRERVKARILLSATLRINRFNPVDWVFLAIFSLSDKTYGGLREFKHEIFNKILRISSISK
jgi:GT2 family glycosyltransferase